MATQQDVVKTLLQLIGVTSLFIAAKLEVSISSFIQHNVNGYTAHLLDAGHIVESFMELVAIIFFSWETEKDRGFFSFLMFLFFSFPVPVF